MILLNNLKTPDVIFFVSCLVIIAIIFAIWLLIPVFNKRQYKDQRESLRKREALFRASRPTTIVPEENAVNTEDDASEDSTQEEAETLEEK